MNNKKSNGVLELVILRNDFYRDSYHRAAMSLFLLILINFLLAIGIIYEVASPPKPQYFSTTSDGRLINWHALTDPAVADSFVIQWAVNAVSQSFSLDFIHWRHQLQVASDNFTNYGWKTFLAALKKSNNLRTLESLKMVSNAQVQGAPKIIEQEVVDGRYAWKLEMPILVTYTNNAKTIPISIEVTLIVLRVSVGENSNLIAINNFLPLPRKIFSE